MPKTRASKASAKDGDETLPAATSKKYRLPPQRDSIPKVFILPDRASQHARIVTLPNPRDQQPSRYLVCPETGIYEFTKVLGPKGAPRSWFIESWEGRAIGKQKHDRVQSQAQILKGAESYIASVFDPMFLLLPALADASVGKDSEERKRFFLECDEYFDKLADGSPHLTEVLRWPKVHSLFVERMKTICDVVDAGDGSMFRLNDSKLLKVVMDKAKRLSQGGLPRSMEDKFVTKALQAPILVQKRILDAGGAQASGKPSVESGASTPLTASNESLFTSTSSDAVTSGESQPSTTAPSMVEETPEEVDVVKATEVPPEIVELQRLRASFNLICSRYINAATCVQLRESLLEETGSGVDFKPLDEYLARLVLLRSEAAAARSIRDYSRKRARDEEDDDRAEKKQRLEEEKRRKASESRGVKELKKVNTAGMKKMSDFFRKK